MVFITQGPIAQLGERCVRNAEVEGSIPFGSTTSEQATYRLLRLFQTSERTHFAVPPKNFFQIKSATPDFDLLWTTDLIIPYPFISTG